MGTQHSAGERPGQLVGAAGQAEGGAWTAGRAPGLKGSGLRSGAAGATGLWDRGFGSGLWFGGVWIGWAVVWAEMRVTVWAEMRVTVESG